MMYLLIILFAVALWFGYKSYYKPKQVQKYEAEPSVVVYGASFCGWCKKQKEELDKDPELKYKYVECTDPENKAVCQENGVRSYPTVVINGNKSVGFMKLETIKTTLNGST